MIKGDMGKKRFARAQSKYLYQCEEKVSWRWCQPAGIFIVYKLLLLELNSGRKGTKERAVSQHEVWIVIRQLDQIWTQWCKVSTPFSFHSTLAKKQPSCLIPLWQLIRITKRQNFILFCAVFGASSFLVGWPENE